MNSIADKKNKLRSFTPPKAISLGMVQQDTDTQGLESPTNNNTPNSSLESSEISASSTSTPIVMKTILSTQTNSKDKSRSHILIRDDYKMKLNALSNATNISISQLANNILSIYLDSESEINILAEIRKLIHISQKQTLNQL